MEKSYIWSLPTRVFHALFAVFILLAFLTGDEDNLLLFHAIIGYAIFILLFLELDGEYLDLNIQSLKIFL